MAEPHGLSNHFGRVGFYKYKDVKICAVLCKREKYCIQAKYILLKILEGVFEFYVFLL